MESRNAKTTERVFVIFETIARKGPVSLADLTDYVNLPRSAVHRAVQTLQKREWVRARLYDHCYELSSRFDMFMANCRAAHSEVEEITPILKTVSADGFFAEFGLFTRLGFFELLESTDKHNVLGEAVSLVQNPMPKAILRKLPTDQRVRHAQAHLNQCSREDEVAIKSGIFAKDLTKEVDPYLPEKGYLLVRPILFRTGNWGVLGVRGKTKKAVLSDRQIRAIEAAIADLERP